VVGKILARLSEILSTAETRRGLVGESFSSAESYSSSSSSPPSRTRTSTSTRKIARTIPRRRSAGGRSGEQSITEANESLSACDPVARPKVETSTPHFREAITLPRIAFQRKSPGHTPAPLNCSAHSSYESHCSHMSYSSPIRPIRAIQQNAEGSDRSVIITQNRRSPPAPD
jgi:hypothetical protein